MRRQTRSISPTLVLLCAHIYEQLSRLNVKPPVTLCLLAVNIYAHVAPIANILGYYLSDIPGNCIIPREIVSALVNRHQIQWNRLIISQLIHADDTHLYYNMLSLCWKGLKLEASMGSMKFGFLVLFSAVAAPILMVAMSATMNWYGMNPDWSSFNTCAVGFSAILFSLKYVLNQASSETVSVMGISILSKNACWLELVLISLITPNASFMGHLAGILAGMLYMRNWELFNSSVGIGCARRYTYHSGTASTNRSSAPAVRNVYSSSIIIDDIDDDPPLTTSAAAATTPVYYTDGEDVMTIDDIDDSDSGSGGASSAYTVPDTSAIRARRLNRFGPPQSSSSQQQFGQRPATRTGGTVPPKQVFL